MESKPQVEEKESISLLNSGSSDLELESTDTNSKPGKIDTISEEQLEQIPAIDDPECMHLDLLSEVR